MKSRFPFIYELLIWLLYVCLYKYSYFLDLIPVNPTSQVYFPHLELMFFAVLMTVYIIPFYRWIAPILIKRKQYVLFPFVLVLYFGLLGKLSNLAITFLFYKLGSSVALFPFYQQVYETATIRMHTLAGWDPNTILTDILACLSLSFTRFAFETIARQYDIENQNLKLQMESLKTQLQPHFLFNTLNSIYGMSILKKEETSELILRLSDMMRYVLYDCQQDKVALKKDAEFLQNYLEMEKVRYPRAVIDFEMKGMDRPLKIAPLLLIQFMENSFKHGTARVQDKGLISGHLYATESRIDFKLSNEIFKYTTSEDQYAGVGITNARKRLELYYPNAFQLEIANDGKVFTVSLTIKIN